MIIVNGRELLVSKLELCTIFIQEMTGFFHIFIEQLCGQRLLEDMKFIMIEEFETLKYHMDI